MATTQVTPFQLTDQFTMDNFNERINETNIALSTKVNPNLLDNWYFGNPVNQRGQTSYTVDGYGIDRWRTTWSTVTVAVVDGEIQVIDNATDWNGIVQLFENWKDLAGKTVTLSALGYTVGVGQSLHLQYSDNTNIASKGFPKDKLDLISFTTKIPESIDNKFRVRTVRDGSSSGNSTLHLKAIKLELGDTQTLAHQDANGNWVLNEIPDYGEQLARCQRYFIRYHIPVDAFIPAVMYGNELDSAKFRISLPTTMRTTPSCTFNGVVRFVTSNGQVIYPTSILADSRGCTPNAIAGIITFDSQPSAITGWIDSADMDCIAEL